MLTYVKGSMLDYDTQQQALRTFVNRFTGNHIPPWAKKPMPSGGAYPMQFKDDKEWLENTDFAVTKSGKLDGRADHCSSFPTWPNNPELRHDWSAKS